MTAETALLSCGWTERRNWFVKALVKTSLPDLALPALLGWRNTCEMMAHSSAASMS